MDADIPAGLEPRYQPTYEELKPPDLGVVNKGSRRVTSLPMRN